MRWWNWIDNRMERLVNALGETGQVVVFLVSLIAAVWFGILTVGPLLIGPQCVGHDRGMDKVDNLFVWLGTKDCPK